MGNYKKGKEFSSSWILKILNWELKRGKPIGVCYSSQRDSERERERERGKKEKDSMIHAKVNYWELYIYWYKNKDDSIYKSEVMKK